MKTAKRPMEGSCDRVSLPPIVGLRGMQTPSLPRGRKLWTIWLVASVTVFVAGHGAAKDLGPKAGQPKVGPPHGSYVVFEHHSSRRLLESYNPGRAAIVEPVSCALAKGEFESLQLGIRSTGVPLANIRIDVDIDLDFKVYHRADDEEKQRSACKFATSLPANVLLAAGHVMLRVPQDSSASFWITFHANVDTPAGKHAGTIRIQPHGRPVTSLPVCVTVRDFVLQRPRIAFGMYHPHVFWDGGDEAERKVFEDMADHGQTSIMFYGWTHFRQLPPAGKVWETHIPMAMKAGLAHADIPCFLVETDLQNSELPDRAAIARKAASYVREECAKRGWPELVWYAIDEPSYPRPGLRENFRLFRDLPIRLGTAMGPAALYGFGDLHDIWIGPDGLITPQMRAEARRLGAEVWTYSFRNWWPACDPLRPRFFAGLYTWAHGLTGNLIWAYFDNRVHSHVWYKSASIEPMPVLCWETRREGIDDYRYLQMLESWVAAKHGDPLAAEAGGWLETVRGRVIHVNPDAVADREPLAAEEYDAIRAKAVDYIWKLGSGLPCPSRRQPATALRDEAELFRGRTLEACVSGLADEEASVRRAAAWRLLELGPDAAPAVRKLAESLQNPDVRFPALRALEAIGPDAYPAVPQVAALLHDPDSFVRLGAAFALGAIGSPLQFDPFVGWTVEPPSMPQRSRAAIPPLLAALKDNDYFVVQAAGQGLPRFGAAARAALPQALEIFNHPNPQWHWAGLWIITGLGPEAASAVPKLVQMYEQRPQQMVVLALAAIGPAAAQAIPALENASPSIDTNYALFCIRGEASDLENMIALLGNPQMKKSHTTVMRRLNALGAKAEPAAGTIRRLLESQLFDDFTSRGLEAFLERVKNDTGAVRLLGPPNGL